MGRARLYELMVLVPYTQLMFCLNSLARSLTHKHFHAQKTARGQFCIHMVCNKMLPGVTLKLHSTESALSHGLRMHNILTTLTQPRCDNMAIRWHTAICDVLTVFEMSFEALAKLF